MQARRLLLFIGIVMLLAVAAASLVPPPEQDQEDPQEEADGGEAVEPPPAFRRDGGEAIEVEFRAPPVGDDPEAGPGGAEDLAGDARGDDRAGVRRTVREGKHVVVTVRTPQPGQVELEGLGLLQTTAPNAPAVFDLFTDEPGEYPVIYTSLDGEEHTIGTLLVESASTSDAGATPRHADY